MNLYLALAAALFWGIQASWPTYQHHFLTKNTWDLGSDMVWLSHITYSGCCRLGSCEACCKWSAAQMILNEWCEFRNSAHGKASTVPPAWAAKDLQLVQHTQQKHPVYSRERCVQGVFVSTIKQVQSQLNCVVVTIITIQLCSFYFSHNFSCVGEVAMS